MDTKKWYKSKTIWTAIITITVALYNLVIKCGATLPYIPEEIYIILGALGIYSRKVSNTKIGK